MFADMVGYTAAMQDDEAGAYQQRARHRAILAEAVGRHHGEVLEHYGDGSLSIFASAVEAVECAVEIQRRVAGEPLIPLRIGVHTGDIVHEEEGIYGDGVNVASRIESLSAPGGVMVSGKVFDEIKNHPTLSAVSIGAVRLKNVAFPMSVFAISSQGIAVPRIDQVRARVQGEEDGSFFLPGEILGEEGAPLPAPSVGLGEAFLQRVRERALIPWALVYLAGAWVVLSIARFAGEGALWPAIVTRAVAVFLFVGFFVAMVVAWYHGEKGRQRVRRAEVVLIAVLLAGGGWALSLLPRGETGAAVAGTSPPVAVDERPSVAALPWVNRSGRQEDVYFVDGIHDEILTRLYKIGGLRVISRQSVMQFRDAPRSTREIAAELGVRYILEAGLLRIRDTVRINVQLIDAHEDHVAWAVTQDRYLTMENLFAIQSEIAQVIADTLRAAVTPEERTLLGRAETDDLVAYDFYLQGRSYFLRPGYLRNNFEAAEALFAEAVARDPEFALAWAALSLAHGQLYWEGFDRSGARLAEQRAAAERALALEPDLPQAHQAVGLVHYVTGDFERALTQYQAALEGMPNDAGIVASIGYAHRRLGHWPETFDALQSAVRLNPRDATLHYDLGGHSFAVRRRYQEAMASYNRALTLAPDLHDAALRKGFVWLHWRGRLDTLATVVARLPPDLHTPEVDLARLDLALWQRDGDALLEMLRRDPDQAFETQLVYLPRALYAGWAHTLRDDGPAARAAYDSARVQLESVGSERAEDPRILAALGFAYAGLGRTSDAARAAARSAEVNARSGNVFSRAQSSETSARILASAGLAEEAVAELEVLLAQDSPVSSHTLGLDPFYDPVRASPRFRALLDRHADEASATPAP